VSEQFIVRGLENLNKLRVFESYLVGHNGFIAGGCFKNIFNDERVKDIDIFFRNSIDFNKARIYFEDHEDYNLYYENDKVTAYKNVNGMVLELVCTTYGTPEEIISKFDFSITKFAMYVETVVDEETKEEHIEHKIVHHKYFFEHLFFKRLVIDQDLPFPISSFERSLRYKGYGYSLCKESKAKLVEAIRTLESIGDDFNKSLYDGMD
jgi:hypothetical protein